MTAHCKFSGPLYQQIYALLKNRIISNEWPAGTSVPGDNELSQSLGVSVGTVRKALDQLAREGFVFRERGRGTFVKDQAFWCDETKGWLYDPLGRPVHASIKILESETSLATADEQKALKIKRSRSTPALVHRLLRRWTHDGSTVCVERIIIDATIVHELPSDEELRMPYLTKILLPALRHGAPRTVWTFHAFADDDARLGYISQHPNQQLLSCRRITYGAYDTPLEISDQLVQLGRDCYRLSH